MSDPKRSLARELNTKRRSAAVELVLAQGYKWDGEKWLAPKDAEIKSPVSDLVVSAPAWPGYPDRSKIPEDWGSLETTLSASQAMRQIVDAEQEQDKVKHAWIEGYVQGAHEYTTIQLSSYVLKDEALAEYEYAKRQAKGTL